ncbi:MAG TPA: HAD family phosphatase [Actinomycetes bacterium]|nr:HAD family phosphatase [Actinomycetes bacterium]
MDGDGARSADGTRDDQRTHPGRYRGLLVDFGGVLTSSVIGSFQAFCESEGLAADAIFERLVADPVARKLVVDLECGRIDEAAFEPGLATALGVQANGLIDRLFAGMLPEPEMPGVVLAARRAGIRTGLLSNSWGAGRYDRDRFGELFDGVVISGEVGLRKPDPAIYALGARSIGVEPDACVFVDDFPHNLEPARTLGMATVHHTDPARTAAALEILLGVPLRS